MISPVKLGDICDFINGGNWSDKEYVTAGIPVLKVSNFKPSGFSLEDVSRLPPTSLEKYQKNLLQTGDMVIATVGSHPNLINSAAGRSCSITDEVAGYLLNQNAVCVRTVNSGVLDQRYLTYLGKSFYFQHYIQSRGRGAANQMRIAISAIKEYQFELPPIDTQHRIADILSAYDDLIDNNQKQIKLLEEAAVRVYKEWFVHLRFPGHENTPIVDSVPEGWFGGKVSEMIEIKYGKDHKKIPDGQIPVYGSGGFMRKCNQKLYEGESILIPRKGSLNNIMYVNEAFWTVDTMFYTIPQKENYAKYLYFVLSTYDMYGMNIGAAVPSMTTNILNSIDIMVPSAQVLRWFDETIEPMFRNKRILKGQCEKLAQARDKLLPKLMSGEIEV